MATNTLAAGKVTPARPSLFAGKTTQEWLAGFGFVAPALIILGIFVLIPMIAALVISFTDWNGQSTLDKAHWVGLSNYADLLVNDNTYRDGFFEALKNTAYYSLGVVPLQTVLSLFLAIIVNQKFLKLKGLFRTAFYFPSITSSVAVAVIFLWLFNHDGIINAVLGTNITWTNDLHGLFQNFLGLFGLNIRTAPQWLTGTKVLGQTLWNWISGPSVTMFSIMLLATWTTSGTMMLIFLAALQDIPAQLHEAASVDGATRWQQFRKITLPLLRPTTFFIVTIGIISTFQVFDQIYVISGGGPAGTTNTVAWIAYRNAFKDSLAGLGAATAFSLFVIVMIFTFVQRRLMGRANR
ncbi:MAG: carbohydrate ABC transporter permease [Aggregatilineales bacterium]